LTLKTTLLDTIRAGDRVTVRLHGGINLDGSRDYIVRSGSAVMRGPHGWVLNMGGRYGTPAIANEGNIVKVSRSRKG
jgi:hypothetical protein